MKKCSRTPEPGKFGQKVTHTTLSVTLPDGRKIQEVKAKETFAKAILEAGVEKVEALGFYSFGEPFIYDGPIDRLRSKGQYRLQGNKYVYHGIDNDRKSKFLQRISNALNLGWKVEFSID